MIRLLKRFWWTLPLALVAASLILWELPAERLAPTFAAAIERGLNRKVEVKGKARFVPWRLGFSLADVVIHDDPRFGVEPLAYVVSLEATVRLTSLLAGRFEIDRLRLVDPSVNLAQAPEGWNFPALLDRAATASRTVAPPEVEVSGGRLNVRFGESKSVYYLDDTNLTLGPGGQANQLSIYFDGVPARTDRADRGLKGFGRLSGRGTVELTGQRSVNLSVALARSAASELLLLFQDRGSSVTGFFSGSAKLKGPLNAIQIDGRLGLEEFARWTWLARDGNGPGLAWNGVLNWTGQQVHLETKPGPPVSISLNGDRLMGAARWQSEMHIADAPAEALEQLAGQFGFRLPGGPQLAGQLSGTVGYQSGTDPASSGLSGAINFSGGTLAIAGKEAAVEPASVSFEGTKATLAPVVIRQDGEVLRVEATYQWNDGTGLSWAFSGNELDLGRAREWGMALPGRVESGRWKGSLRYEAATGGWHGEGDLADASIDAEGLNAKVHIDAAHVKLEGAQFALTKMAGQVDDVPFKGEFQFDPNAPFQSQVRAQLGALKLSQVRLWVSPMLERQSGVLSRTFGIGTGAAPAWVGDRRLTAQLQADSIALEDWSVGPIAGRLEWSKGTARLLNLTGPGRMRGQGEVVLFSADSSKASQVSLEGIPWRGGTAAIALDFNLLEGPQRARIKLDARDITFVPSERWAIITGEGEIDPGDSTAQFTRIEIFPRAGDPAAALRGTGEATATGEWRWDLKSANANRHLVGPGLDGPWRAAP